MTYELSGGAETLAYSDPSQGDLPVRHAPVRAHQVRHLVHLERRLAGGLAVELHAEAGAGRRQDVAVPPLQLDRHYVRQQYARLGRLLLDPDVRGGEVELGAGGRRDRAE